MPPTSQIKREGSPIAVLRDRRDISEGEHDIRLDDYLNDKLQTAADFQNLDSLIASVEVQRVQLQSQLQDAQSKLVKSRQSAAAHTHALLQKTKTFEDRQTAIDRRLAIVTASDTPDEAVEKFKVPIEKLRRLDLAHYYVEMLQQVDTLAAEARNCLPERPKDALKPYAKLKELSILLQHLQGPADEAAGHLVTYVNNRADVLWDEMKEIMLDDFDAILKKSNWPTSSEERNEEWTASFERLLELQTPEILNATEPMVLLPMAALTKTFAQQFRYHFMGTKATSSKIQPDYFLQWTVNLIENREAFLYDNIGPILVTHFANTRLATEGVYIDPVAAFITALLPVVREKVNSLLTSISHEPSTMSNFMLSLMKFDDDIREKFKYDGGESKTGWKGLTWEALDTWFPRWLSIEKDFALARYQDIINSKDNSKIDYDSTGPKRTKPTYGAQKVTDLIANVTKQYESLRKFSFKLRFLIDIQIAILDAYHNRLKDSLDAYIAMTSTVGRALHGVTKEQQAQVEGVGGLESLCKVYGSSNHVIDTLHDWSNELFFVDLWNELQVRAKKTSTGDNLAEAMSYEDVKNSTSASVGSEDDGGLFDETINAYKKRREHAERLMIETVKYSLPAALRAYIHKPNWLTLDNSDTEIQPPLTVTAEFDAPLQILERDMSFLHRALATAPFRRIMHEVLDSLQDSLWSDVLLREKFTRLGAAQFYRDLNAVWALIDVYITDGSSSALGMPRLREALVLLNLPEKAEEGGLAYGEAYERVFADNTKAKELLEGLGFRTLTYLEARQVLERRQE